MAEAKTNGFRWLPSYYIAVRDLPDDDRLALYDAIADYGFGNDTCELPPMLNAIFSLIRPTLDKSIKFEEKQKANGNKGGRPKGKPKETQNEFGFPESKPKETQTDFGENLDIDVDIDVDVANDIDIAVDDDVDKAAKPQKDDSKSKLDEAFEAFWIAYPKKVGKKDARRAFSKVPHAVWPRLVPAIEAQKKSRQWQRDGGQYIPNPATWLNQGRWDDEAPEDLTAKKYVRKDMGKLISDLDRI